METLTIQHIQGSFSRIYSRKAALAERFYFHLFENLPEVKPLFKGDFSKQKDMFEAMLGRAVRELSAPNGLEGISGTLLKTHSQFQFSSKQLEAGGHAFMAALHDTFGEDLTKEEAAAWEEAIMRLMRGMLPPDKQ